MRKNILLFLFVLANAAAMMGQMYSNTQGYKLQSRPNANICLYLDFTCPDCGTGKIPMTLAYAQHPSDNFIDTVWQVVSQDLSIFDVNVTTDVNVYNTYGVNNRLRYAYGNNSAGSGSPGYTSFKTEFGQLIFYNISPVINTNAFYYKPTSLGNYTSSKLISSFSLKSPTVYSGNSFQEYLGNGHWGALGVGFLNMLVSPWPLYTTWTNGNYPNAGFGASSVVPGYSEDQIELIGGILGFVPDDYTKAGALNLESNDSILPAKNNGLINKHNDIDSFKVVFTGTGSIDVTINPTSPKHTNLDVEAVLIDHLGNVVVQSNIFRQRHAVIQSSNLAAGTYYLLVKAGGEGSMGVSNNYLPTIGQPNAYSANDAAQFTGFSNYGSNGYFTITGKVSNAYKDPVSITLNSLKGFGKENCSKAGEILPTIEVANTGTTTVSTITAKIYVNNVLFATQNINAALAATQTKTFSLNAVTATGSNTLKVVISANLPESNLSDNEKSENYSLLSGTELVVSSNNPFFATSSMSWTLTDTVTKNLVFTDQDFVAGKVSQIVSQNICVQDGCYDFKLSGSFSVCSSKYFKLNPYVPGTIYNTNDTVRLEGKVYSARWYIQSPPPGADWKELTAFPLCNEFKNSFVKMVDGQGNDVFPTITTANYSNPTSKKFCFEPLISSVNENNNDAKITLFPNPTNGEIMINTDENIQLISVYSLEGKLMFSQNGNSKNLTIENLVAGTYIVSIQTQNAVKYSKVIKE